MSYKNAATAEELEAVIGGDVPVAEAEHAASADSAAQAAKVGDANVGSSTRPVYLDAGTPKQCGSTLNVGISGKAATAGTADRAARAERIVEVKGSSADDLNKYFGAEYYGKIYYWAGGQTPVNAPPSSNGGALITNRIGATTTCQIFITNRSSHETAPPAVHMRSQMSTNTWTDWEEIVTSDGNYPNMGAGKDGDGNVIASTYAKVDELSNETQLRAAADQAIMALIDDIEDGTTKVAKATTADKVGSADVGSSVLPVWVDNGTPKAVSIKTLTTKDDIGYDVTGDRSKLLTLSAIAFWNGAFQSTTSNLQYCAGGTIQPKPTLESKSIAASAWTALEGSDPFKFQANVTISKSLSGNVTLELLNDDLAAFRSYGYQIGAVSGQTVTIWAAAQPTASVTLSFYIYTR